MTIANSHDHLCKCGERMRHDGPHAQCDFVRKYTCKKCNPRKGRPLALRKKRHPRPKRLKDGELSVSFGYTREDGDDIYITNGHGCPSADAHLIHQHFNVPRPQSNPHGHKEEVSLVKDLESRGYDIRTLRFTIQKMKPETQERK